MTTPSPQRAHTHSHPMDKQAQLLELLRSLESVVVAFSGGVDSTYLLSVAGEALPSGVLAATVRSALHMKQEGADAAAIALRLNVPHRVIDADPLADPELRANSPERCYICKRAILGDLVALARAEGCAAVVEGSNVDDLGDYRPGMRAVRELGIRSPLLEVGLTKTEIRQLARDRALPNWEKPAMACLASRIPYGTPLTANRLSRIDRAEDTLHAMGFVQVRVRDHGAVARVEIPPADIGILADSGLREQAVKALKGIGYTFVTIDLEGYRTGSLNQELEQGDS